MVHSQKELEADGTWTEEAETDPVIEEQQVRQNRKGCIYCTVDVENFK